MVTLQHRATATTAERSTRRTVVFFAVLFVVALNLRGGIASLPPLSTLISDHFALSETAIGALTTLPVLCLGVFALCTPWILRQVGSERAVLVGLCAIVFGVLLRSTLPHLSFLYFGTILMGAGIGVLGAILPPLVRERAAAHAGLATGFYAAGMAIGAAASTGLSIPLVEWFDSWRASLAFWILPAIAGVAVWLWLTRKNAYVSSQKPARVRLSMRNSLSWVITLYVALQSFLYFAELAWLAPSFSARGYSLGEAGGFAAVFTAMGILGTLGAPILADRVRDKRWLVLGTSLLTVPSAAVLAFAPHATPWIVVVLLGLGQSAAFALGLVFLAIHAQTPQESAALTARAFSVGYTLAATGPLTIGWFIESSGGYTVPFAIISLLSGASLLIASRLSPQRRILDTQPSTQRHVYTPVRPRHVAMTLSHNTLMHKERAPSR